MDSKHQDTTTTEETAYLTTRGWFEAMPVKFDNVVFVRLWRDPIASARPDMPTERALTIQRARDAAEKRAVWAQLAAAGLGQPVTDSDPEMVAVAYADNLLRKYVARFFADHTPLPRSARAATAPPPPCTGAGTIPPRYCGVTSASSTAFDPAPCGVCGQVIEVDGFMRTVTHAYRLPEVDEVMLTSEHNAVLVSVGPATARLTPDGARRLKSAIGHVIADSQLAHAAGQEG